MSEVKNQHQSQKLIIEKNIECEFYTPGVEMKMYRYEIFFLVLSLISPFISLIFSTDKIIFVRSGSLMLFFAAIAEFLFLNKVNFMHIVNDCRVLNKQNT